jgi:heptosyltransferase-2
VTDDILVVRFSSLGDVILVSPTFRALKQSNSKAKITFLTRTELAELYSHDPDVDSVWAFDPREEPIVELARKVRERRYATILDLHGSIRSRLICARSRSTVSRYRKQSLRRAGLVAPPPFKIRNPLRPVVDRFLEAAGTVPSDEGERVPAIHLPEEARRKGVEWGARMRKGREGRLVALLLHAKHAPKEWPAEHFDELARRISDHGDLPVIIPAVDTDGADGIREGTVSEVLPGVLDLASALAAADAVVSNDSGPMHLAAAVGTLVLGLFGPTSPELGFAPVGSAAFLHRRLYCSPCSRHGKRACWRRKRHCMVDMTPEDVFEALNGHFRARLSLESP